jgi:ElaB/YqjD/DUF883 family membrane-anchored ribosome-binding protein
MTMTNASGQMANAMDNGAKVARDAFGETRESIGEAGEALRKAARETAKEAKEYGRQNAARAIGATEDAARSVLGYINERPVQAAMIGIGGLLLAGLLLRRR